MWDMWQEKERNTLLILQRASPVRKSGGKKVTYTNPIAVAKNGGWRYGYGNMFYVELVNQYLTVPQVSVMQLAQKVMNEALKYQGWKYVYGAPAIEKSDYEPKTPEADTSVDADTVNDATAFLETFFKLYPTATEKELAYYVSGNVLEPIGRDYLYSELINPVFTKDGDNVKVKVAVKFLDNQTKATQVSQYELVLHKDSNWKIIG